MKGPQGKSSYRAISIRPQSNPSKPSGQKIFKCLRPLNGKKQQLHIYVRSPLRHYLAQFVPERNKSELFNCTESKCRYRVWSEELIRILRSLGVKSGMSSKKVPNLDWYLMFKDLKKVFTKQFFQKNTL